MFYECDQFVYSFVCARESSPLGVSPVSRGVSVALVESALQCDVLAGLDCCSARAVNFLGWDEILITVM